MPIQAVVEIISSKPDVNGNRYHIAIFYNTARTRSDKVVMDIGGPSNARGMMYQQFKGDYEATLVIEYDVTKREWERIRRMHEKVIVPEGTATAINVMNHLFS